MWQCGFIILFLIGCQSHPTKEQLRKQQQDESIRRELIEQLDLGGCVEERAKCLLYSSKEFHKYCEIDYLRCKDEREE